MYVCNCNGISERPVKKDLNSGANTWTKVHAHYGYSPSCGKCQIEIRKAIENHEVLDSSPESLSCSAAIA